MAGCLIVCHLITLDEKATDPNPFRYCGEYWDGEAQTYYLRNRDYNPENGRFTREDPIRDGENWYSYGGNNPVMFADPLGLARVNIEEYAYAMGAKTSIYYKDDKRYISVSYNGITANYSYFNSGTIDDSVLNARFGFRDLLTSRERESGYEMSIYKGVITVGAPGSAFAARYERGAVINNDVYVSTVGAAVGGKLVATAIGVVAKLGASAGVAGGTGIYTANEIQKMLSNVIANTSHHIMQTKHAWELVGARSWAEVSQAISHTLTYGQEAAYKAGNQIYTAVYNGQTVQVITRVVDGVARIIDAWVKTK